MCIQERETKTETQRDRDREGWREGGDRSWKNFKASCIVIIELTYLIMTSGLTSGQDFSTKNMGRWGHICIAQQ